MIRSYIMSAADADVRPHLLHRHLRNEVNSSGVGSVVGEEWKYVCKNIYLIFAYSTVCSLRTVSVCPPCIYCNTYSTVGPK